VVVFIVSRQILGVISAAKRHHVLIIIIIIIIYLTANGLSPNGIGYYAHKYEIRI